MRRAHPHPHSLNDAASAAVPRQPESVTCTHSVAMAAEPKVHPPNSARSRCPVDMARNQIDSARGSPPCQLVVRYRVSTSESCATNVTHDADDADRAMSMCVQAYRNALCTLESGYKNIGRPTPQPHRPYPQTSTRHGTRVPDSAPEIRDEICDVLCDVSLSAARRPATTGPSPWVYRGVSFNFHLRTPHLCLGVRGPASRRYCVASQVV